MKYLMIFLITEEKLIPWYCVNTMLLWHDKNYENIMNMLQRKYLKLESPEQTMPDFYDGKTKFKPQATVQWSEKRFLIVWPYLQYFRF